MPGLSVDANPSAAPLSSVDPRTGVPSRNFGRLALVQALRGIAACWVVLFHAAEGGHIVRLRDTLPGAVDRAVFQSGELGVAIFFALSGFVIAYSIRDARLSWSFLGRFALRRSIRLDPAYWASMLLVVATAFLSAWVRRESWTPPTAPNLIAHIFYLQNILNFAELSAVYWTLTYEVQFYLFFVGLLVLARSFAPIDRYGRPLVWSVFFMLAIAASLGLLDDVLSGLFVDLWHCFFVGVLAYLASTIAKARPFLAILVVAMIARSVATESAFAAASAATAMLLFWAVRTGVAERGLDWRWLQFLGAISYSLYLTHNPISGAVAFGARRAGISESLGGDAIVLLIIGASTVGFATLFWYLIEQPSHRLSRRVSLSGAESAYASTSASKPSEG